jgi:hypothetical protein
VSADRENGTVVGLAPWLPWPLRASAWWTRPVRAERLAALRIGLAVVLLADILISYWPDRDAYFGPHGVGRRELFSWYNQAPRWHWSVFRGLGHSLLSTLALGVWLGSTVVIAVGLWGRRLPVRGPADSGHEDHFKDQHLFRWSLTAWPCAGVIYLLGLWVREVPLADRSFLCWLAPLVLLGMASVFLLLEMRPGQTIERIRPRLGAAWIIAVLCLAVGIWFQQAGQIETESWLYRLLVVPWEEEPAFLTGAMAVWMLSVAGLLVGCCTRVCAVVAWVLSTSFANLNPNIDNAGDTVRGIILFYLMLCPCGAAWSIDSLWERMRGRRQGPVLVYPWALRLLFVQMVCIYFFNGLYKLFGADWRSGEALYYVLCDLSLSRFSYSQIALPFVLTQILTWTVLVWEVGFPVWVAAPLTRAAALWMGVAFHVSILLTLELGGFGPYMLVLYLPLLPWRRDEHLPEAH